MDLSISPTRYSKYYTNHLHIRHRHILKISSRAQVASLNPLHSVRLNLLTNSKSYQINESFTFWCLRVKKENLNIKILFVIFYYISIYLLPIPLTNTQINSLFNNERSKSLHHACKTEKHRNNNISKTCLG